MEQLKENIAIKRELNRFLNRFFYHKEKSKENLARMYFYLDDFITYVTKLQEQTGNELLEKEDFSKVYIEEEDVKVFLDEELKTILIDKISGKEKDELSNKRNKDYLKKLQSKIK